MPNVYSYMFAQEGEGPWWGIRCHSSFYQRTVRQMNDVTRCFIYMTNSVGETLALAVEGPHDQGEDNVFVPPWVLQRLGLYDGEEVIMDAILEALPACNTITIRPVTGRSVEGPMFLEGLTEALNQLGIIQQGLLSAVVDPSLPEIHEFMIESLDPATVCLADGELRVNIEPAMDCPEDTRPETPLPQHASPPLLPSVPYTPAPNVDIFGPMIPEMAMPMAMASPMPVPMPAPRPRPVHIPRFVAFTGVGHTLG